MEQSKNVYKHLYVSCLFFKQWPYTQADWRGDCYLADKLSNSGYQQIYDSGEGLWNQNILYD